MCDSNLFLRADHSNYKMLINIKNITAIKHLGYDKTQDDCIRIYVDNSTPYPYYDVCSRGTPTNKNTYNMLNDLLNGE